MLWLTLAVHDSTFSPKQWRQQLMHLLRVHSNRNHVSRLSISRCPRISVRLSRTHSCALVGIVRTCVWHLVTCCIRNQPMGLALGLLFMLSKSLCKWTIVVIAVGLIDVCHDQLLVCDDGVFIYDGTSYLCANPWRTASRGKISLEMWFTQSKKSGAACRVSWSCHGALASWA